jgi:hypothetical protein
MVPVKVGEPDPLFDRTRGVTKGTVVNIVPELINHYPKAPFIAFPARASCHRTALAVARWTNHLLTRREVDKALPLANLASPTGRSDSTCSIALSTWMPVGCSCSDDHDSDSLLFRGRGLAVQAKERDF